MFLKELILKFLLWEAVVVLKLILRGCSGPERSDSKQFLLWEDVVFFKELIFNSFYFERMWCS